MTVMAEGEVNLVKIEI